MPTARTILHSLALLGWMWCASHGAAVAQTNTASTTRDGWHRPASKAASARPEGQLTTAAETVQPARSESVRQAARPSVAQPWTPTYRVPAGRTQLVSAQAETVPTPKPEAIAPQLNAPAITTEIVPGDIVLEPFGTELDPFEDQPMVSGIRRNRIGYTVGAHEGCDSCGGCGDEACPHCGHCGDFLGLVGPVLGWTFRHSSLFAGVQGFKGPMDGGRQGNFGFHEGFNLGGPLGDPWGWGYQVGLRGTQSNFADNNSLLTENRNQVFMTAGLFSRAKHNGLQGGVAFDYLHDSYYDSADLMQIRTETSLLFGVHEIGFMGAFDAGGDDVLTRVAITHYFTPMQANDTYALFYRRHFTGGGIGRVWGGASGHGDGLIGAEATIPLGTTWALENNFVYLLPQGNNNDNGFTNESWSVSFSLVWYPGRASSSIFRNPFTPLFNVADNSSFMVRRDGVEIAK